MRWGEKLIHEFLYYRKCEGENKPDLGLNNCQRCIWMQRTIKPNVTERLVDCQRLCVKAVWLEYLLLLIYQLALLTWVVA